MFKSLAGAMRQSFAVFSVAATLSMAVSSSVLAHEFKLGDLEIIHPWSRETPDSAKVAAGYLKVVNRGNEPDRLVAVTGAIAGKTEIHEMSVDANGVMKMREVGSVEIPAGGEVELKPGSFHIMFMDLSSNPKKDVKFQGRLTFEKAGSVDVEFDVDAMGNDDHGGQGNHGG